MSRRASSLEWAAFVSAIVASKRRLKNAANVKGKELVDLLVRLEKKMSGGGKGEK